MEPTVSTRTVEPHMLKRVLIVAFIPIVTTWCHPSTGVLAESTTSLQSVKEETASDKSPGTPFTAEQIRFFKASIRPILEKNCFKCHGGENTAGKVKIRSDLQLISRAGLLKGGTRGPALNLKDPARSLILEMISYKDEDFEMPPQGKATPGDDRPAGEMGGARRAMDSRRSGQTLGGP